ncbi:MAG: amino acid permease [Acidobacteriota bacterium]|nr:amino acid permease [Acidobacteriota bacterium]
MKRELGLASATAIIAGQTIAVGIFLTPAGMAKALASPFWLLMVWLVMGVMTLCGALSYSVLACRYPETGGSFVYLKRAYGARVGFLYGWMCLAVMDPGLCAALAMGLASYLAYLTPLSAFAQKMVAIGTVLAIAGLNVIGTRVSAALLNAVTWVKIAILLLLPLWAFVTHAGDINNFLPFIAQRAGGAPLAGALAGALIGAFFSFGGWWEVSRVAGEVRDPGKTLPKALLGGVLLVLTIYIAISAVFIYLVPIGAVGDGQAFVAQMGTKLFGVRGGKLLAAIVALSIVSSLAAFMMAVPRVYFAMAKEGGFVPQIAEVSPRFGTPARAIALQAALASVLILAGNFEQIIAYFIFTAVLFLGLTVTTVFGLHRRGELVKGFAQPYAAAGFTAFVVLLLVLLAAGRPRESLAGLVVTAVGALLFRARPAVAPVAPVK